jgi:small-conductance mechanosensitive channel/ABC-type branched-subunit amino acid transport system substrate-binding protein
MSKVLQLLQGKAKWRVFWLIMIVIVVVSTVLSAVARFTLVEDNIETRPRLALVVPTKSPTGIAMQKGVQLFLEQLTRDGGINGRSVELMVVEEGADAPAKVMADKRVIGVVGYLDAELLKKAAPQYEKAKLRVVTPLQLAAPLSGVTSLGLDPREESRFAANYARNIQQRRLMYVIREEGADFDALVEPLVDVYQRFDTPVKQVWTLPAGGNEAKQKEIIAAVKDIDVGAIYIATRPELAARLVHSIRGTGNALDLFGPSALATGEFSQALKKLAGKDADVQNHGIIVATPVLFDTANERAQRFQSAFQRSFSASPDWVATVAHDAAHYAVSGKPPAESGAGIMGNLAFVDGLAQVPTQMGVFNGNRLISAPIQLLPIAKGAGFNYIDALRQGRVLYVNDRFMFKTSVVYVGVTLHEVSNIDKQKETATLDMSIWFRYRGKFDPQDMDVVNAVEPVKFDKPEEIKDSEEVQYRRYRVKQTFKLNFTADKRAYNQNIAGISFRHRLLNRNNLTYVVDVLGMPTGNVLADDLRQRRILRSGSDWGVENAWISQDLVRERGDGAPQYVGMTGEQPLFSTITFGVLLSPEVVAARDIIPNAFFLYIAIFGLVGAMVGQALDSQVLGRYWVLQSWLLRLAFWPCLLLGVGNMAIDWAFLHWAQSSTQLLVMIYEACWWVLGAQLVDMAVRRFGWIPLELTTGRQVPNVMKFFVTVLIFALAFGGIIAVVFNQPLTSLLATSGVLAMVVGLAIQANIANVFSGIILNVERPFKVGDFIKINNIIGQVTDITWRTTRMESNDGPMVSLANSKVSEAMTENFSNVPHGIAAETRFYAPSDVDPAQVLEIINEAVAKSSQIVCKTSPGYDPMVRYRGVVNLNGRWVGEYSAGYRVAILPKKGRAREELWRHVREKFLERKIPLIPVEQAEDIVIVEAKPGAPTA